MLYDKKDVGFMMTPNMGNKLPTSQLWAADTGCFTQTRPFVFDKYITWLQQQNNEMCLFATCPDVVGNAFATLQRTLPTVDAIRAVGYKVALVGQDGMEHWPIPWTMFDAFFIGGTTEWKLSKEAAVLVTRARQLGKWVHMGRVNSLKRLQYAHKIGCHSADGTYVGFGPRVNAPKMLRWLDVINLRSEA